MLQSIHERYAHLLASYCLSLKPGDKVYVTSTILAEPLVKAFYKTALSMGAHVEYHLQFSESNKIFLETASEEQLAFVSPLSMEIMKTFDAYLVIRAPYNLKEDQNNPKAKNAKRSEALRELNQIYFDRTGSKSMRRCLCQYPTLASAQEAGMSLTEYEQFVYNACKLFDPDPRAAWEELGKDQQRIVDYLNKSDRIQYKNQKTDIQFSVKGRTWINSDGKSNMPSGEVFSAPIEDSVNGHIYFDYPSIFWGQEIRGISLEVSQGEIIRWHAEQGQDILDQIMDIPGARFFGEVAIGTNYLIQQATKNILFDEKIGGSIHMAIGQTYYQAGGKNESSIHWDMIADMKHGGQIFADGTLIYENGIFLI